MQELLKHYSISDIIIFIVIFALAIKSVISFMDWAHERLKQQFNKENITEANKNNINKRFEKNEDDIKTLQNNQQEIIKTLENLNKKIDILIESDKDDIKADLTRIHHYYCYTQKWIDDYTLDCAIKRYNHYKDEGGNSFIYDFMKDLKALPKKEPDDN